MTSEKIGKIIAYVAIVLVLVGGIGFIAKFTNGFQSELTTFYLTVNDDEVLTNSGGYAMSPEEPLVVNVKYIMGKKQGYTVKVVPNVVEGMDFNFSLDGEVCSYQAEKDLTSGFDIQYGDGGFTIAPKGENAQDILRAVHPDADILFANAEDYPDMFNLVITTEDGKTSLTVGFVVTGPVSGIKLDIWEIIF